MTYFLWACALGAISAVSLPLGSWVGLRWKFSSTWISIFAAFGAGALLAALSVELVAPTTMALTESGEEGTAHHAKEEFFALIIGCIGGGLLYVFLNKSVDNRGGFIRRTSTTIQHDNKEAVRERKELIETLSSLPYFKGFRDEQVDELLPELEPGTFEDGDAISRQGAAADEVFLVLDGNVSVQSDGKEIAKLGAGSFAPGLLALVANSIHIATGIAVGQVKALRISKEAFHKLRSFSPEFDTLCRKEATERLKAFDHLVEGYREELLDWSARAKASLSQGVSVPSFPEQESKKEEHSGSPLAVWLGMVLDGIPESLVIGAGMLWALKPMLEAGVEPSFVSIIPFTFLAGLFLSNFPEALSSSANMLRHGMKKGAIFGLWVSLMLITSIGAGIGYLIAGQLSPTWTVLFEGLSAGAMLTMIVAAMIPEAVLLGSANVAGLSTLAGFLGAILFKLLE